MAAPANRRKYPTARLGLIKLTQQFGKSPVAALSKDAQVPEHGCSGGTLII
jgi:hypothetical protein